MKDKNTLIIIMLAISLLSAISNAQNVNIPDANFKSVLISNSTINTDSDSEIQISEAAAFSGTLNVTFSAIYDLTGIEAFTSLTSLNCSDNQLTTLNISNNVSLTSLICNINNLTNLDVSSNINLTFLNCGSNELTSLSVSANTALTMLFCYFNLLTDLDISANSVLKYLSCEQNLLTNLNVSGANGLEELRCYSNQLTHLDISTNKSLTGLFCSDNSLLNLDLSQDSALKILICKNNQLTRLNLKNQNNNKLTSLYSVNNPNLYCIEVDDAIYSNTNWSTFANKDTWASYNEYCNVTGISNVSKETEMAVYPDPGYGFYTLIIPFNNSDLKIEIIDISGRLLKTMDRSINATQSSETINISELSSGIYFVRISNKNLHSTIKVVKSE